MPKALLPLLTVAAAFLVVATQWWFVVGSQNLFWIHAAVMIAAFMAWLVCLVWSLIQSRFRTWPLLLTSAIVLAPPVLTFLILKSCGESQACF